jgi:UDP-2,3-diacylglucosamine pyrophosphatase LpxH
MRNLEILVLSDLHLGTYGSRANQLLQYLKSVSPKHVILNGDLIDFWQLRPGFWPQSHTAVIEHVLMWLKSGVRVDYICGNHDETLRRFLGFTHGNLSILNELVLEQNGKKVWFTHGDLFDGSMENKRLAKWGGRWYDRSIYWNDQLNRLLLKVGLKPVQISKSLKDGVKRMVNKKHKWEETAAEAAVNNGYDLLVVGHIHKPEIREIQTTNGRVLYLNSGDWMENLSSLEYQEGKWTLYRHGKPLPETFQEAAPSKQYSPVDEVLTKLLSELGVPAN